MIGALVGVKEIPNTLIDRLISFDCTNARTGDNRIFQPRPKEWSFMHEGFPNIRRLLDCKPIGGKELQIIRDTS